MKIYYEDAEREVEPNEILSITVGSIVEGCDIDGPTITLERKDGTLTKANFNKALDMINKECDNVTTFRGQQLSDEEIDKEILKIFMHTDTYNPEWGKEQPYALSLYQLGRELYKNTDCGPWTSFEVKDQLQD